MTEIARPNWILKVFKGRTNRRLYWLLIAGIVALFVATAPLLSVYAGFVTLPLWLLVAGRRLHDFGRTAWWALIPFGAGFARGLLGDVLPISEAESTMALGLLSIAVALVIGIWPGDAEANRFGARPGRSPADMRA
ncbi:Inner membrane protein YhaH [compost metagenome]